MEVSHICFIQVRIWFRKECYSRIVDLVLLITNQAYFEIHLITAVCGYWLIGSNYTSNGGGIMSGRCGIARIKDVPEWQYYADEKWQVDSQIKFQSCANCGKTILEECIAK